MNRFTPGGAAADPERLNGRPAVGPPPPTSEPWPGAASAAPPPVPGLVPLTVRVLLRRWRWCVAAAAVAVTCAAGLVGWPPAYVATVDVLITASVPERNQSLVHLVRSAAVERAVQAELADDSPAPSASPPHQLRDGIKGHLVPRSNTIVITVRAPTPAAAERLAAAWGRVYERQMNRLVAPSGGGEAMPLVTLVSSETLAAPERVPYVAVLVAAPAAALAAAALLVLAEYAAAAGRAPVAAGGGQG